MESTSMSMALLTNSGASNHMMARKYSFSSLDTIYQHKYSSLYTRKRIPINLGDDSTIISKGQGVDVFVTS